MQQLSYQILDREEVDENLWNECISESGNLMYGYTWYLDTVAENWKAIVYENYEAVFPITYRRKYGVKYLYQPFFTQQLGLFAKKTEYLDQIYPDLFKLLKHKFRHISIQLNHYYTKNFDTAPNYELRLNLGADELRHRYSNQTKRNLSRAKRADLVILDNLSPHEIIEMFVQTKGKEISEVKPRDYKRFEQLCLKVAEKGKLRCFMAMHEGKYVSGIILFYNRDRITMVMLASTEEGRDVSASTLLIDNIVGIYSGSGILLDFEGSRIASLARFYAGFGAENRPYAIFKSSIVPFKN